MEVRIFMDEKPKLIDSLVNVERPITAIQRAAGHDRIQPGPARMMLSLSHWLWKRALGQHRTCPKTPGKHVGASSTLG